MFRTRIIAYAVFCAFIVLGSASLASAEPIKFEFRFEGGGGDPLAVGYIVFEKSLLPNPGNITFNLPNPAVLGLSITISGSTSGNGTFGMETISSVNWNTNGATLDLSRELVGQPTPVDSWGTPSCNGGDFNFFSIGGSQGPNGVHCFVLCPWSDEPVECMELTSMIPLDNQAVPTLNTWGFVALALTLAVIVVFRYRRRAM